MPTAADVTKTKYARGVNIYAGDTPAEIGWLDAPGADIDPKFDWTPIDGVNTLGKTMIGGLVEAIGYEVTIYVRQVGIDMLAVLFPMYTLSGSTNKKMILDADFVGEDLYDYAEALKFKPVKGKRTEVTDENEYVTFAKGFPVPNSLWRFNQKPMAWQSQWILFPDLGTTNFLEYGYAGYATSS